MFHHLPVEIENIVGKTAYFQIHLDDGQTTLYNRDTFTATKVLDELPEFVKNID